MMDAGRWREVRVVVPPEGIEAATGVLLMAGASGVAVEEGDREVAVAAYVPWDEAARWEQELAPLIARLRREYPSAQAVLGEVRDEDWAHAWRPHYRPVQIGRVLVVPEWEPVPEAAEAVVRLDPGLAFGTGQHVTTQQCLLALQEVLRPGDAVLDAGCGSGILGLAALALGAGHATLVDVDPIAVSAARRNAELNGLNPQVWEMDAGRVAGSYQVVVCNIVADVILSLLPSLSRRVAPGGWLVLGGVVADRAQEVEEAVVREGLRVRRRGENGGWVCLVAGRGAGDSVPA